MNFVTMRNNSLHLDFTNSSAIKLAMSSEPIKTISQNDAYIGRESCLPAALSATSVPIPLSNSTIADLSCY